MARTIPDVLSEATLRGMARLERERQAAESLLSALDQGERSWKDLSVSERRLLTGAPIVEYFLQKSFALRYSAPQEMVFLAERARQIAEGLPTRRYGARVLADLCARAWADLGNARRVAENFVEARNAMATAAHWAKRGTGDRRLAARLADLSASLLSDLGEFPEALGLLSDVRAIYRSLGDGYSLVRVLIKGSLAHGRNNELEKGAGHLLRAFELLHIFWDPQLEHQAKHSLALTLAESGSCLAARRVLETPRIKTSRHRRRDRLNRFRRYWLEGKISAGLGEYGRAEGCFHIARLGFLKDNQTFDAALASLDLALMFAKQGKRLEVMRLAQDMIATFKRLGIAREAIASLLLLVRSCKTATSKEAIAAQVEAISTFVAELQRSGSRRA